MSLEKKFFVTRDPETTEEKLSFAMAILEIYADPENWEVNNDRRFGDHRVGEFIVLRTHNIVAGWTFAREVLDRTSKNTPAPNLNSRSLWERIKAAWGEFRR